jgi:hypothetical protein
MKWNVKPSTAHSDICAFQRWAIEIFFKVRKITNPQILGLIPLSQIRKFLHNAAQLCLKTFLKFVFFKRFFLFRQFELEHYMLQYYICKKKKYVFADLRKSATKLGSANGKSTNYESANHKIDWARNLQIRSAPFVEGPAIY